MSYEVFYGCFVKSSLLRLDYITASSLSKTALSIFLASLFLYVSQLVGFTTG